VDDLPDPDEEGKPMKRNFMIRTALIVIALTIGSVALPAQPSKDERDQGKQGVMSLEELRQEPIRFELDIPYAATDNPRQRLDLYLPKEPGSDKLPLIVFFHGGGWPWRLSG
jgi:acetyl esterase/lipase